MDRKKGDDSRRLEKITCRYLRKKLGKPRYHGDELVVVDGRFVRVVPDGAAENERHDEGERLDEDHYAEDNRRAVQQSLEHLLRHFNASLFEEAVSGDAT